jgi:L-Ala-D/L-Glu epimerase
VRDARAAGLRVMVGCMVGTSLVTAPAVLLAQLADWADLDGPLLLDKDRDPGLYYEGSILHPSSGEVWG